MVRIGTVLIVALLLAGCSTPAPSLTTTQTPSPQDVWLFINSDPEGAIVILDGIEIGQTPCQKEVAPGRHTIICKAEGYYIASKTIEFTGYEFTQDVQFALEMTPEKKAQVEAEKAQAEAEKAEAEKAKIQAFKDSCQTIEYRILKKNPDVYKDKKLTFTGQIVQILEEEGLTFMRVNITKDEYGYWDDTVAVFYLGSIDVYEDDIIQFWGIGGGSYTYESTAGWNITIPRIDAKYIEKLE
jgi:hypothetical protein